ncbi:recombinase family protein [Shewanella marinintestina]|uniref:recombinase family protein n=1 Tax=Shewanella marinintestina TaxID=190305 RepID=UPI00200E5CDF|nr:recombinase family protein [Shewanella marinintestina]MCL1148059.1 recombinase family protein [Shewanella marinintestina]
MGFIRAYLRVSTVGQDVMRAKEEIAEFAKSYSQQVASFYFEKFTGTSLNRPELSRLLAEASAGDIILIESVDRISRLKNDDWIALKNTIESKGISIVALDLPTSHIALRQADTGDEFVKSVLRAVNGMLLDILAATARKDYDLRRKRTLEGIAKAQTERPDAYQGRKRNQVLWDSIGKLLRTSHTYTAIQQITGASRMTIAAVAKELKHETNTLKENHRLCAAAQ